MHFVRHSQCQVANDFWFVHMEIWRTNAGCRATIKSNYSSPLHKFFFFLNACVWVFGCVQRLGLRGRQQPTRSRYFQHKQKPCFALRHDRYCCSCISLIFVPWHLFCTEERISFYMKPISPSLSQLELEMGHGAGVAVGMNNNGTWALVKGANFISLFQKQNGGYCEYKSPTGCR